jgi:nitrate reductase assembly molybdenum cofactor insertion protein NarJ
MTVFPADLYRALAETLTPDGPPVWLARAGREWPLCEIAACLGPTSEGARRAVEALAEVRAESLEARRTRYSVLFGGAGRPRFWLYESAALTGRILGPATFAVEKLYRATGLERVGAELPDHASLELAFLAHLAAVGQDAVLPAERQFIERHAGRWLPSLGRALARSGD